MGGGAGGPSGKGDSGLPDVAEPQSQILAFQVEKHLTWEKFLAWTQPDSMKKTQVSVFLPKFKLGKTYNMRPVLSGLRVAEAFQPGRADFSGMSHGRGLCLSALAHRSVVEVNEEGTEAAAASAAIEVDCGLDQPRFCADHPFLFFIRHNGSRSTLFCGRFSSP